MTFEKFFKQCEFDFWQSYYDNIPYVTVTFKGDFCEHQYHRSIHKKLYFEDRETAKKLAAKSLYEELIAVREINDFRKILWVHISQKIPLVKRDLLKTIRKKYMEK